MGIYKPKRVKGYADRYKWTIVDPDGGTIGTRYLTKADAEEVSIMLDDAFTLGRIFRDRELASAKP